MAAASPHESTLPMRSASDNMDDAVPDEDSSETTKLFYERLQAWKHACGYLEDYVKATEKLETDLGKDYSKVLKTVSSPLKEGHHFHQQNGGVAEMFDHIRSNTQGIANSHSETAKTLRGTVLPIFERLHGEIKSKAKELDKGAGKASKAVERSRNASQKHIELLGQQTSNMGGKVKASEDPYIVQRQVYHRLHKQVIEENNNREDTIAVQNEFATFEAHVLQTIQQGLQQFYQVMARESDDSRNMYGDMIASSQRIPPDFEWRGFINRNNHVLIDPNGPKRSIDNIGFPNQDHPSTRPLIAGSLERRGKLLKKYDAGYYVVTPSKYLHEFKSDDDFAKDPAPENSLYLPDCLIGAVDGVKFNIKGKDQSGAAALNKMSMSHEYAFKAHTPDDARKWHDVILGVSGGVSNSAPSSPVVGDGGGSAYSPTSPSDHSQTTGSIGGPAMSSMEHREPSTSGLEQRQASMSSAGYGATQERDLAGNTVVPSAHDEASHVTPAPRKETHDYAPL